MIFGDKIKGSIIGGSIGDALGYPIEFVFSFHDIQKKYGENGIMNYDLEYTWLNDEISKAQVSDDTQIFQLLLVLIEVRKW